LAILEETEKEAPRKATDDLIAALKRLVRGAQNLSFGRGHAPATEASAPPPPPPTETPETDPMETQEPDEFGFTPHNTQKKQGSKKNPRLPPLRQRLLKVLAPWTLKKISAPPPKTV
jgi:hypothetical protein